MTRRTSTDAHREILPAKLSRPAEIGHAQLALLLADLREEIESGRIGQAFAERWGWCIEAAQ